MARPTLSSDFFNTLSQKRTLLFEAHYCPDWHVGMGVLGDEGVGLVHKVGHDGRSIT